MVKRLMKKTEMKVYKERLLQLRARLRGDVSAMAGAIALAGYLGFNPPDFAAGTVALAFGLAASSIFPALMMGIFYKRMNKEGAIAGMVAGIGVTLFYVFQHKGIMFIPGTSFLGGMSENWFLGIEPNAIEATHQIRQLSVVEGEAQRRRVGLAAAQLQLVSTLLGPDRHGQ